MKKNALIGTVATVLGIVLAMLSAKYSPGAYEALCSQASAPSEAAK